MPIYQFPAASSVTAGSCVSAPDVAQRLQARQPRRWFLSAPRTIKSDIHLRPPGRRPLRQAAFLSGSGKAISGNDSCSTLPRVSNTARSMTFSSSRTLPGQLHVAQGAQRLGRQTPSTLRPRRRAIFVKVKAFASSGNIFRTLA